MKPIFKHISLLVAILMVLTVFTGQIATSAKATEFSNQAQTFSAGAYHSVFIWPDGSVGAVGYSDKGRCDVTNWENIISVSSSSHTVGLRANGTVVATGPNGYGQCEVSNWSNMVAISAGVEHTVGLCANGAVVAVGKKDNDRCDVSDWEDIVAITAGNANTYGLKSNGKVLAVGSNASGQKDVSGWNNIQQISAGYTHVVGLKENGTVVATGNNSHGQCDVSDWKDIVAISAGHHFTLGLKADGTVVSTGDNSYGQCNVRGWTNIVAISAGQIHSIGLCSDGTLVSTGSNAYGQCNIDKDAAILTTADRNTLFPIAGDVVQVVLSHYGTQCAVLRTDGTVRVIGDNTYGQCDTTHWQDVVKIWVDLFVTFGLTKDGTVLATYGDYSDWTNVANLYIDLNYDDSEPQIPYVIAVKTDGTVITNFSSTYFSSWENIKEVVFGRWGTFGLWEVYGLTEDGSVIISDDQGNSVKLLDNIKVLCSNMGTTYPIYAISTDGTAYIETYDYEDISKGPCFQALEHKNVQKLIPNYDGRTIHGITESGTVFRCSHPEYEYPGFQDITELAAFFDYLMGVKKDGSVVISPNEEYEEYIKYNIPNPHGDMSQWTNIVEMKSAPNNPATVAALREDGTLLHKIVANGDTISYNFGEVADFWVINSERLLVLTKEGKLVSTYLPEEELEYLTAGVET